MLSDFALKLTIQYQRHGARLPIKLYNEDLVNTGMFDKVIMKKGQGQLTKSGAEQMIKLGEDFSQAISLKQQDIGKQVYVYSTPKDRTKASSFYFLQGMLPQKFKALNEVNFNDQQNSIKPIKQSDSKLNIHVLTQVSDVIQKGFKQKELMTEDVIFTTALNHGLLQKERDYYTKQLFPYVLEKFDKYWKTNFSKKGISIKDFSNIYDVLYCCKYHSINEMPQYEEKIWKLLQEIKQFYFYEWRFVFDYLCHLRLTRVLEFTKHFLTNCIDNKEKFQPKLLLYSGHDTDIVPFSKCLGINQIRGQKKDWKKFPQVNFGDSITLNFWQKKYEPKKYFISFNYNNTNYQCSAFAKEQIIQSKNKKIHLYQYDEFQEFIQNNQIPSMLKYCYQNF